MKGENLAMMNRSSHICEKFTLVVVATFIVLTLLVVLPGASFSAVGVGSNAGSAASASNSTNRTGDFSNETNSREKGSVTQSQLKRHLADAERYFKKAVELDKSDPDSAKTYYHMAIMHYKFIENKGHIRNGKLFYDIGNAYFRMGDIGRAILNYKRASLYIPNDENLKQNLEYARSRRKDKIERTQRQKVFKTLFFLHYDLSSGAKILTFIISFAFIWLFALVRLFVKRGAIKVFLVVSAVIAALFATSLTVDAISASRRPQGVIIDNEVIARKGDAETYQPAFKEPLHSGTEFFLLEKRAQWMHIQLDNGSTCWISPGSGELIKVVR